MLSSYTVDGTVGGKYMKIKTSGYEKMEVSVMVVLADGTKLPPYVILNYKTAPKKQLPRVLRSYANPKAE